jgi:hypothetical protein
LRGLHEEGARGIDDPPRGRRGFLISAKTENGFGLLERRWIPAFAGMTIL